MTSISNNFVSNATPIVQKNVTQPTVDPKSTQKTGMSTAAKVGIGAAAVATAVIAGLAIKNKAAISDFMKQYGKIKDLGKEVKYENVYVCADDMAKQFKDKVTGALLTRLDEAGLKSLGCKKVPKDLAKRDGVIISLHDKDKKLLGDPQIFIADSLDQDLLDLFGKSSNVRLT